MFGYIEISSKVAEGHKQVASKSIWMLFKSFLTTVQELVACYVYFYYNQFFPFE